MANPKKEYQSPECGPNIYIDQAKASADSIVGAPWFYFGPAAGAPMPPILPVPPPLAPAAAAALQAQAKNNAIIAARAAMAKIAAYLCPNTGDNPCSMKENLAQALNGPALLVTPQPELVQGVTDIHIPIPLMPLLLIVRWQYWHQEATQDYEVSFDCVSQVQG